MVTDVPAQLLLDKDDLLRSSHNKVSSRIERALVHLCQFGVILSPEHTLVTPQHYRKMPDRDIGVRDNLASTGVLHGDDDRGKIARIPQPALVWGHETVRRPGIMTPWLTDSDIGVFEPETRVDVRGDLVVRFHDLLQLDVDEVVE